MVIADETGRGLTLALMASECVGERRRSLFFPPLELKQIVVLDKCLERFAPMWVTGQ